MGIAINAMNSLASAFCILFLLDHHPPAPPPDARNGEELSKANVFAVLGAGAVGALAYTFTDTFLVSAIEGEVYALRRCSRPRGLADAQMGGAGRRAAPSRWIVLIAYLMGLSIGVHISTCCVSRHWSSSTTSQDRQSGKASASRMISGR